MKFLLKNLGQIQCAKVLRCLSGNQDFIDTLTWGVMAPQSLHLPLQKKTVSPIPVKSHYSKGKR